MLSPNPIRNGLAHTALQDGPVTPIPTDPAVAPKPVPPKPVPPAPVAQQSMWSSIVNWFSHPMTILILVALVMLIVLGFMKVKFY